MRITRHSFVIHNHYSTYKQLICKTQYLFCITNAKLWITKHYFVLHSNYRALRINEFVLHNKYLVSQMHMFVLPAIGLCYTAIIVHYKLMSL